MSIQFTPSARSQFLAAITYIKRDNPEAARHFRRRVEDVLRRLEKFPDSGRVIPEFPELPYREVIVAPYRFFYRREGASPGCALVLSNRRTRRLIASRASGRRDRPWPALATSTNVAATPRSASAAT